MKTSETNPIGSVTAHSLFSAEEIELFKQGLHYDLYNKFGSKIIEKDGQSGSFFAVWAPNAKSVSVIGNFNDWNKQSHYLKARWDSSGIWEGFIPGIKNGFLYKYHIESNHNNYQVDKKDLYSFFNEIPPNTASIVWDLTYDWKDKIWLERRHKKNALNAPMSIYEIHIGSWRRVAHEGFRSLSYREMAEQLVPYMKDMGFTHVEFMPVMDHPFYGSWGYQTLGYFAPSNRYGTPQDFMYLIDCLHQNDIGVILDWVPSHFPSDESGLVYYDGTHLFEHADPQKGIHPDWNCYIFNNGRNEIKEFLISSALFWLEKYHVDGLRVDAVASLLYLDYSRKDGEWSPNVYGGRDNLDSIAFIRQLNRVVYQKFPDVQMIAEESTAWSQVSRPVDQDGLGFGMKWNMGWMHDTLKFMNLDPVYRKFHHGELTFSMLYAFTENFVLSLSHDEVVHGKGSLINKMPCDDWQKFANLRLLYSYMYAHPGKKLLFMGSELAQWAEWNHDSSLDWHLLQYDRHAGIQLLFKQLNYLLKNEKAFYEFDFDSRGHEWIDVNNWEQSIISFVRKGNKEEDSIVVICNFTPVTLKHFRVGMPQGGQWYEMFNSDAKEFGGSNHRNWDDLTVEDHPLHGREHSLLLNIPPLGTVFLKKRKDTST
ncbi:MAG: 1,4-alpha-glucan branching protein GlgB [Candidatus Omnitrophica bacterium]|nr:1,4-alpha-glucan branching protein GlgB [Candidatus Omnitrophota bacterium]